jgi:hypothetical protein
MNDKVMHEGHIRRHGHSTGLPFFHAARHYFRHFVVRFVAPISRHPAMTLITGFGLFVSGSFELAEQIFTHFDSVVGIHQGVILLGIVTFLRGLADLVEASEWLSRGTDEEEAEVAEAVGTAAVGAAPPNVQLAELRRRFG